MNKEVLSKLQTLCARGEHATYELRQRMEKWGVDQSEQDEIIDSLIANHYVDDSRYAAAFVLDKMKFNHNRSHCPRGSHTNFRRRLCPSAPTSHQV